MKLNSTEKIAKLFIEDESSLEILLMLNKEGSKSIKDISNSFSVKADTIKNLSEYDLIHANDNKVSITSIGDELVSNLIGKNRKNIENKKFIKEEYDNKNRH